MVYRIESDRYYSTLHESCKYNRLLTCFSTLLYHVTSHIQQMGVLVRRLTLDTK